MKECQDNLNTSVSNKKFEEAHNYQVEITNILEVIGKTTEQIEKDKKLLEQVAYYFLTIIFTHVGQSSIEMAKTAGTENSQCKPPPPQHTNVCRDYVRVKFK
jgi:hypothetical protein